MQEAVTLGKHSSEDEALEAALKHYVQCLNQGKIVELFGTIDFDPEYDYKKARWRRKAYSDPDDDLSG